MLLRGIKSSLQRELDSFFKTVLSAGYNIGAVTKGALSQSRSKLKPEAFKEINGVACSSFYSDAPYRKWHGHRLLPVDGSRLHLPSHPGIKEESGEHLVGRNGSTPVSMALISLLYDPLNLLTSDSRIGPWSRSEQSLLLKHYGQVAGGRFVACRPRLSFRLPFLSVQEQGRGILFPDEGGLAVTGKKFCGKRLERNDC
jgi:hypothetical protein